MSTNNLQENSAYFNQVADELAERAERLRPLWHMTREERLAAFHRGDMTREQMFAWAARHPNEVPRLSLGNGSPADYIAVGDARHSTAGLASRGEYIFIAASTPEACVACPVCGDDEVLLAAGGSLAQHPDRRHPYDPKNPKAVRPVCPASHVKPADAVGMTAEVTGTTDGEGQEHALAA